ncbi:AzlC family ABC transporter permease [Shewanella sp. 4t3-1-2LB]|uniref:AzlC family ABC transporter permease n=1 Tax=Shewanella sp. 4t3-1-2LB TaxID=2817682 RepID=UPI001A993912|nr:AzlC family ABC transporter permease [Shewanella sp. 4t3-1-2LB]MBO1272216.1 AzlC family ABC transporter permease [Shewanella sp. 4t3-1-2LB]
MNNFEHLQPASAHSLRGQRAQFFKGAIDIIPLCLAVLPWGLLAGSMAIQSGLDVWQSLGMSAIIFAGAAQLVTLSMLISGANVFSIIITIFFLTSQHFIYGLTLREFVTQLKLKYCLPIGFLLTDELFALSVPKVREQALTVSYLIGAGLTFYLFWVIVSALGIWLAASVPDLAKYHLDFSIIATFITIVVPMIKSLSTLAGVLCSLLLSAALSLAQVEGAIVIAGIAGMMFAVAVAHLTRKSGETTT